MWQLELVVAFARVDFHNDFERLPLLNSDILLWIVSKLLLLSGESLCVCMCGGGGFGCDWACDIGKGRTALVIDGSFVYHISPPHEKSLI